MMGRILVLLVIVSVAGCTGNQIRYSYDSVYARYVVRGGVVEDDRYITEYVVSNTTVSFTRRYVNGTISYTKSGVVSEDEYRRLGREFVDDGVFGMLEVYSPSFSSQLSDRPEAELFVVVDGQNKTVRMKPMVEEYMPGNLKKAIIEVKGLTQSLQG